ncbi:2-dehydro-3-deoxygalactonokinase [Bosea sp. (in: a-proteobacteria)]|jgi:2-dehydro-3-deoxygalactonokinase|uniref:2-dehydro-3-deoxygalactonokinase n=1 Tax=Bosea sp. (in: a-proteobacteria) TaxID=1871050 RepID=UPI0035653FF4
MPRPLIALDWGTTRARAFLISESGEVLERRSADQGIQSVPPGGFPAAFDAIAGDLRRASPDAAIVLAGMVGSRNGWIEAHYVACPASPQEIAAAGMKVTLADGSPATILPGLSCDEGAFDVMRGEETLIVGLGLEDGIACLPGTHSKWARIEGGRITRFASFMTGEIYGLLRQHSILSRLAQEPTADDAARGTAEGLAAAARPGGLLNTAFASRSEVLAGRLPGGAVGPYLSALLVGHEVAGAQALLGRSDTVHLVADGALAQSYGAALAAAGIDATLTTPEVAFIAGVRRLFESVSA